MLPLAGVVVAVLTIPPTTQAPTGKAIVQHAVLGAERYRAAHPITLPATRWARCCCCWSARRSPTACRGGASAAAPLSPRCLSVRPGGSRCPICPACRWSPAVAMGIGAMTAAVMKLPLTSVLLVSLLLLSDVQGHAAGDRRGGRRLCRRRSYRAAPGHAPSCGAAAATGPGHDPRPVNPSPARPAARSGPPTPWRWRTSPRTSAPRAGKAARAEVPRVEPRGASSPRADRDPVALLEEQAPTRVPELVPIRYGRMLVSPFTSTAARPRSMAADLAATPRTGLQRAALRRRAPVELRRLRLARARARLRPQRLRRDAARARSSGTSSGWPRASRSPARDRGFTRRERARCVLRGRRARTARRCASSRDARTSTSGTRGSTSSDARARTRASQRREAAQAAPSANVAKARTKDSMQASREAHASRRRRAADRQRPAADRPDRRAARRATPAERARARSRDVIRGVPRARCRRPARTCSSASATSTSPARSSASAASARAAGSCCCSAATTTTRCSCRSRRRRRRCSSRTPARASTPTTASASSRASA